MGQFSLKPVISIPNPNNPTTKEDENTPPENNNAPTVKRPIFSFLLIFFSENIFFKSIKTPLFIYKCINLIYFIKSDIYKI